MSEYKYSKYDYRVNPKIYMYSDVSDPSFVEAYFLDRRQCLSKLNSYFQNQVTSEPIAFGGDFNFSENFDFKVTRDERQSLVRGQVDSFKIDHRVLRQMITRHVLDYDILEFLRCRFEISKTLHKEYRYRKPVIESLDISLRDFSLIQICWLLFFETEREYKFLSAALKLGDFFSYKLQICNENVEPEAFSLFAAFECEYNTMHRLLANPMGKIAI